MKVSQLEFPLTVIGIDPGFQGAIAVSKVTESSLRDVYFHDIYAVPLMESPFGTAVDGSGLKVLLANAIDKTGPSVIAAVEKLHDFTEARAEKERMAGFRRKKQKGSASFFTNYGVILGILQALNIPVDLVSPQSWQRLSDKKDLGSKEESIIKCLEYYPEVKRLLLRPRSKTTYQADRAEAVLIARAAIIRYLNGSSTFLSGG